MCIYIIISIYIYIFECKPSDDTFLDDESVKITCRLEERGICLMVYIQKIPVERYIHIYIYIYI